MTEDPRIGALPDSHGHAKGEHKAFAEERPIPYTARMLFLWFFHACRRGAPRFMMVADHINYLTFEDPAAVHVVRRALKLAQAGDLYGAAETAGVELGHAQIVSEGLRKGMRYSIGAEVDNDPRSRPDAQNIVDAMKPDGIIRSVHFLPITHPQHGENWMWAFDNPEFKEFYDVVGTERVWELYVETLLDAIDKLPGHIVGHFYVPGKFGHWPDDAVLEGYEDRLIEACAERGMAVEINSRYLYKYYAGNDEQIEKFRALHLRLMRKAKAKGVMIAVGSDAHSPRDQGNGFAAILALLDEADVNEIAFPLNDRLARVALRATPEILRQHSAALAAAPAANARALSQSVNAGDGDGDDDERDEAEGEGQLREAEPRVESRNANAEIILPPGSEPEPEPEPEAPAAPAAKAKAAPRPRKSRAKPKTPAPSLEPEAALAPPAEVQPAEVQPAEVQRAEAPPAEAAPAEGESSAPVALEPIRHPERVEERPQAFVPPSEPAESEVSPGELSVAEAAAEPVAQEPALRPSPRVTAPKAKRPKAVPAPPPPPTPPTHAPKTTASVAAKSAPAPKAAAKPKASPAPRKAVAKKAAAKKPAPAKKAAPVKKAAAKKAALGKKSPAKKSVAKKTPVKAKPGAPKRKSSPPRPPAKKSAPKKSAKKKSARR